MVKICDAKIRVQHKKPTLFYLQFLKNTSSSLQNEARPRSFANNTKAFPFLKLEIHFFFFKTTTI